MLNFQFVIITYFNTLFFDDFFGISSRHLACLVVIYNLVPVIFYREMLIVRYRHFLVMTTFLFAPHIHRLAQPHRYLLVVTNGLVWSAFTSVVRLFSTSVSMFFCAWI